MRIRKLLATFAFGILAASPVLAADVPSVNCGTQVVVLGDSENDVLQKCGSPSYTVGKSWVYETGVSGPGIVIHFGGGDAFAPKVIRMEEVEDLPGDEP